MILFDVFSLGILISNKQAGERKEK